MDIIPFWGVHEPISSITHLLTAVFFAFVGIKMVNRGQGNSLRTVGLSVYIFCAIFLFSMSGVYHILEKGTTPNYVFRVLDHAGIYLMIAGSFTPFQIILLRGYKRWILLTFIWILAVMGLTLSSIFLDTMPEALSLSFFIFMGWLGLFTIFYLRHIDQGSIKYILMGGVFYSAGAFFEFLRWPVLIEGIFGPHEFFHIMISLAAVYHFIGIHKISQHPISSRITAIIKRQPEQIQAYLTSEKAVFSANDESEIKVQIHEWIERNYLKNHRPIYVRFKYFEEEKVYLD